MPDEADRPELAEMRATIDTLHIRLTSLEGVLRNMSARLTAVEYPAQQAYVRFSQNNELNNAPWREPS